MKKLKVQPAYKVYKPKYPSYEDKNPLLYPETRPYPFTHKFIKWMSTGGLASIMLFSGNEAAGQIQKDSLYNPFPLENARVPYQPVSFGTGMPERLKHDEAIQAIRKAFVESGVQLEEKVWLKNEGIGVYLDGYSHKDKIGFLLLDYMNMDHTFAKNRYSGRKQKKHEKAEKNKYKLRTNIDWNVAQRENKFREFLEGKDKFIKRLLRYKPKEAQKIYANKLRKLAPKKENEEVFNKYNLQYSLDGYRENVKKNEDELVQEIFNYIDDRFEDSDEKNILFRFAFNFTKSKNNIERLHAKVRTEFRKLKEIKSDKKFIKNYFTLLEFLQFNNSSYLLHKDTTYQELKLNIMNKYPINKWFENIESLNEYHNRKFVSLEEARKIDRNNKNGSQFIAPISSRDGIMIVQSGHYDLPEELSKERKLLWEEYNRRNGMTEEVLSKKKAALNEVNQKYNWRVMKDLSKQERDSLQDIRNKEREKIIAKYKAMELLTDEERAEFKTKFNAFEERTRAWQKTNREEIRMRTLRKLEEQVKIYIQWAKSQMGG